jgi:hypothetical protein
MHNAQTLSVNHPFLTGLNYFLGEVSLFVALFTLITLYSSKRISWLVTTVEGKELIPGNMTW